MFFLACPTFPGHATPGGPAGGLTPSSRGIPAVCRGWEGVEPTQQMSSCFSGPASAQTPALPVLKSWGCHAVGHDGVGLPNPIPFTSVDLGTGMTCPDTVLGFSPLSLMRKFPRWGASLSAKHRRGDGGKERETLGRSAFKDLSGGDEGGGQGRRVEPGTALQVCLG